ncbi:MAG: PASTA domain-containing protein [Solirubrobacteraceae bacterium]
MAEPTPPGGPPPAGQGANDRPSAPLSLRETIDSGEVVDDRYTVVSRIGSGGMADVYCAQDSQLGRQVALKVLHRRFAADQEFVERFRREASSAAGLQHPNVVQVFDRGELDGTYYIAMEFLEGRSLKQLVTDEGPIDPGRAIDITVQVLRAARFAHKRGVIHRDIKPHNVIIDGEGRVKVTDFGIARAGASDMTETGAIMGTAAYLSPEQAQGHTVSATSDLYSVGILLYELLTGQVPFNAESAVTIALKQVSEEPAPPRSLNLAVSPELEDVVLRALQKDPSRRFADADEFIGALEHVREAPARPDVAQRTGSLTGVYPALAGYEAVEERERRGRRFWLSLVAILLLLGAIGAGAFVLLRPEMVVVPEVVGLQSDVAAAQLNNAGFEVSLQQLQSDDRPEGEVIRQRPSPEEEVEEGSEVTLFVSSGPGQAVVPDVIDDPLKAAQKAVEERGFKVTLERTFSESTPAGSVDEMSPDPNTQLDIGSTVTLIVSRGPEQGKVPGVVGLTEAEAEAELQEAGFTTASVTEETEESDPGTVIASDPAKGELLELGDTVTLTIAEQPAEVAVPDVRGQSAGDAVAAIKDAGLVAATEERTVVLPDQDGIVLVQQPRGGRLERGSTVNLIVGVFDDSALDPDPTPRPTAEATPTATPTPTP